jgi:hypothetical protein
MHHGIAVGFLLSWMFFSSVPAFLIPVFPRRGGRQIHATVAAVN